MMRLPRFRYLAPTDVAEAVKILGGEGPDAMPLAGGTVRLLHTHLSAFSRGDGTVPRQVATLRQCAARARRDGHGWLLAGDFNALPPGIDPSGLPADGLYGYVSATKWISEIELTTLEDFDGYWIPRGWSKLGPIKTQSRIDTPRRGAQIPAGTEVAMAGVAWAPSRGIERVEISIDGGAWRKAMARSPVSARTPSNSPAKAASGACARASSSQSCSFSSASFRNGLHPATPAIRACNSGANPPYRAAASAPKSGSKASGARVRSEANVMAKA